MAKFVRAVFPMLIVLRLADQKDPVMDKLYFYVRRMDKTLQKSKAVLDELSERTQGLSWRFLQNITDDGTHNEVDESSSDIDSINADTDSNTDDSDDESGSKSLGQRVIDIWNKRREKLVTDFAIAGWALSPIPEIYEDSRLNMKGEHRDAIDRLLTRMYGGGLSDDSDELASTLYTFWSEHNEFTSKTGHFVRAYIWNPKNPDLIHGRSHLWHKANSYFHTKVLGKFACRVCSKIVGMGSAERNWGDVKHLKTEKRSHLSPEAVQKQATIFGASCMKDADLERKKAQSLTEVPYKFWDEEDFDSQFDLLAVNETTKKIPRHLRCYFEDWEQEHVRKKDDVSKAKFLRKYGGLEFKDVDNGRILKIDDKDLCFTRKRWCVVAFPEGSDESEPWLLDTNCPLYDCLSSFYADHPERNVKIILRKNQALDGDHLVDVSELQEKEKSTSPKKRKASTSSTAKKATHTISTEGVSKKRREDGSEDLTPCVGCGLTVGPAHKCDICHRNMHVFCGRGIGEEGHGQLVRCKECDAMASTP